LPRPGKGQPGGTTGPQRQVVQSARMARYFFAGVSGEMTLASRKKRADSSGGVGLM